MTDSDFAVSLERTLPLSWRSISKYFAESNTSLLSDETIVLVIFLDLRLDSIVQCNNGFPLKGYRFFFTIPLEPILAGIIEKKTAHYCKTKKVYFLETNCYQPFPKYDPIYVSQLHPKNLLQIYPCNHKIP